MLNKRQFSTPVVRGIVAHVDDVPRHVAKRFASGQASLPEVMRHVDTRAAGDYWMPHTSDPEEGIYSESENAAGDVLGPGGLYASGEHMVSFELPVIMVGRAQGRHPETEVELPEGTPVRLREVHYGTGNREYKRIPAHGRRVTTTPIDNPAVPVKPSKRR